MENTSTPVFSTVVKSFLTLTILVSLSFPAYSQSPDCETATQWCEDQTFRGNTTNMWAPVGNNYGCLGIQRNPSWFFLQVSMDGSANLTITSMFNVDYALWGPFSDITEALSRCGILPEPVSCGGTASTTEIVTVPPSRAGEVYLLMVINTDGRNTDITISDPAPRSIFDCDPPCVRNGGFITDGPVESCAMDPDLFLRLNVVFNVGLPPRPTPPPGDYSYVFLIVNSTGNVLRYELAPNMVNLPPGDYQVCGLSFLNADVSFLPTVIGQNINTLRTNLMNPESFFCATVSDNCIDVTINAPIPPTVLPPVQLCVNECMVGPDGNDICTPGNHRYVFQSSGGCDSVVTLLVLPKPTALSVIAAPLCSNSCFELNNQFFCTPGSHQQVLQNAAANGCDSIIQITLIDVKVNAEIVPDEPDTITCFRDSVLLDGSRSILVGSMTWYDENRNVVGTDDSLYVTEEGIYTLLVTATQSGVTCRDSETVVVLENRIPPVINVPNPPSICKGDTLNLNTINIVNGNTTHGTITFHSATPPSASNRIDTLVFPDTTTTYYILSTAGSCKGSTSVTLTVNEQPDIVTDASPVICEGESFDLTTVSIVDLSNANGVITFHSGSPPTPDNLISNTTVSPTATTTYYIRSSVGGCFDDASFTLTVNPVPTSAFSMPGRICIDESATINYTGSAPPGANYQWNFGGGATSPGTGQGPHDVTWSAPGNKVVTLSVTENGCTSIVSQENIQVDPTLEVPVISCDEFLDSIQFDWTTVANATDYQVNVTSGQSFVNISPNQIGFPNLSQGEQVTIEITAVSGNSCPNVIATRTCTAQSCPDFIINIDPVNAICLDNSANPVDLNANVSGGAGGGSTTWSGAGITDPQNGIFDPDMAGPGTHTIQFTYAEGSCSENSQVQIIVHEQPEATFQADDVICRSESATINYTGTGSVNATYNWNFDNGQANPGNGQGPQMVSWSNSGTKTVSLTVTENGCASEVFSETVQVDEPLQSPVINCQAFIDSLIFTWNPVANASEYQILINGQPSGTQTNNDPVHVTGLQPGDNVTIEVIAQSANSCPSVSATTSCTAEDCPVFDIDLSPVNPICLDNMTSSITLNASVTGGVGSGDSNWSGPGITDAQNGIFDPQTAGPGTHNIQYTYTEGTCRGTDNMTITVNNEPTASFTADAVICRSGSAGISFNGSASVGATYNWNFDGGQASPGNGQGPHTVTWNSSGSKNITLTVTENGCVSEVFSSAVQVDEPLQSPVINCQSFIDSIIFSWNPIANASEYEILINGQPFGTQNDVTPVHITGLQPGDDVTIEVIAVSSNACPNTSASATCTADDCPVFAIDITQVNPICLDNSASSISLNANVSGGNGTGNSNWSGPGITNNQTGLFDPQTAGPGVHNIQYTYTEGTCQGTDNIQITVHAQPVASFSSDLIICQSQSADINFNGTASVGANYTWDFDGGQASPGTGQGPHTVNWNTPGNKTVSLIVRENGCDSEPFSATVQVDQQLQAPLINCQPFLDSIIFSWNPVANASQYEIVINGQPGTTQNNADPVTVTGLQPGDNVSIQVTAISGNSCPDVSSSLSCTAMDCPVFSIDFNSVEPICLTPGSPAITLEAIVTGGDGSGTGSWSGPGITDPDAGTFNPNDAGVGNHSIVFEYEEGNCSKTESMTIEVRATPVATFTVESPICETETSRFEFSGTAGSGATFNWNFDGGNATPGSGRGPQTVEWNSPGTKNVTLQITDNGCVSTIESHTIEVAPALTIPDISCTSTPTSINFTWPDVNNANSYDVSIDNTFQGNQLNTGYSLSGLTPGTQVIIEVVAIGDGICPNTMASLSCEASSCPPVNASLSSGTLTVCEGETGTLVLDLNGGSGGPYRLVITDGIVRDTFDNVTDGFSWNVTPTSNTTYSLIELIDPSNPDCDYPLTDAVTIEVKTPLSAGTAENLAFCSSETTFINLGSQLSGEDAGGTWSEISAIPSSGNAFDSANGTFNSAGQLPGTYRFRYLLGGQAPCPNDESVVEVIIHPEPTADAGDNEPYFVDCDTEEANLGGSTTSTGPNISYTWTDEAGTVLSNDLNLAVELGGVFYLNVENTATGCSAIDSVTVEMRGSIPIPHISLSPITCFGDNDGVLRVDSVGGTGEPPFLYSINGAPGVANPVFAGLGAGSYTIGVEDANGCSRNVNITITEPDNMVVNLSAHLEVNGVANLGDTVTFTANVNIPSTDIDSVTWEPSHLFNGCDTCLVQSVVPLQTTEFSVTIVSNEGCLASDRYFLELRRDMPVYIPNAFSPNNDGINDLFLIYDGGSIELVKTFLVFDRWGEIIHEYYDFIPSNVAHGWDGSYRSEPLNPGVYTYFAEIEFKGGITEIFKGDITLLK